MWAWPQMFLHYGARSFTPEAFLKAKERWELWAIVHADWSKTLLSGEVMAPEQAKRADEAIEQTKEYNQSFVTPEDEFPAPESMADPEAIPVPSEDATDDVQPFTLEELQAKAKDAGIKGYALMKYDTLLAKLYPVQS